jgi:hypothetical protein
MPATRPPSWSRCSPSSGRDRRTDIDREGRTAVTTPELNSVVESARRLGLEMNEADTQAWLTAIADDDAAEVTVDATSGTFGHRVSMLDFSTKELARFRRIGRIVELTGPPETTAAALALSGSAAQSKIQTYPGDCDYFERFNIRADTREQACAILAAAMRDKVLTFERADTYQFISAKLGNVPVAGTHRGEAVSAGSPMTWTIEDVRDGAFAIEGADGTTTTVRWDDAALDPGWVKLDWVVTDPTRNALANASNVVDVTWEAPDGSITPLDGYLDAYFQEVYLDADDLPTFTKVTEHVSDDALDEYVEQLEKEVRKYLTDHVNYGKAAKRMYNLFRLSGRYDDAAFIRELFDEPTTILYQVWSLVGTLDNATAEGSSIPIQTVRAQADDLVDDVITALEGDEETEIVASLRELSAALESQPEGAARTAEVEGTRTRIINVINTFFRDKLTSVPSIDEYITDIQNQPH